MSRRFQFTLKPLRAADIASSTIGLMGLGAAIASMADFWLDDERHVIAILAYLLTVMLAAFGRIVVMTLARRR